MEEEARIGYSQHPSLSTAKASRNDSSTSQDQVTICSPLKLPVEMWKEILMLVDEVVVGRMAATSKNLRIVTQDVNFRASYFMNKFMPCDVLYRLSCRPFLFNEETIESVLARGAVLSRAFIQHFINYYLLEGKRNCGWLRRVPFSVHLYLVNKAHAMYGDALRNLSLDSDAEQFVHREKLVRYGPDVSSEDHDQTLTEILEVGKFAPFQSPLLTQGLCTMLSRHLVRIPAHVEILLSNGFTFPKQYREIMVRCAIETYKSKDEEKKLYDCLHRFFETILDFHFPLKDVQEVILQSIQHSASSATDDVVGGASAVKLSSSAFKAFQRLSIERPNILDLQESIDCVAGLLSRHRIRPGHHWELMIGITSQYPHLLTRCRNYLILCITVAHGQGEHNLSEQQLFDHFERLEVSDVDVIALLSDPLVRTDVPLKYLRERKGLLDPTSVKAILCIALRACLKFPFAGANLRMIEVAMLEQFGADQKITSFANLLSEELREWQIDTEKLKTEQTFPRDSYSTPIRSPLAWGKIESATSSFGDYESHCISTMNFSFGWNTSGSRKTYQFVNFSASNATQEKVPKDNMSTTMEAEATGQALPSQSENHCQTIAAEKDAPSSRGKKEGRKQIKIDRIGGLTTFNVVVFPNRFTNLDQGLLPNGSEETSTDIQIMSSMVDSEAREILLGHAIINENEEAIRRLLRSGVSPTLAHWRMTSKLGRSMNTVVLDSIKKGATFRHGHEKCFEPHQSVRASNGKDDDRLELLFLWQKHVMTLDQADPARALLARESIKAKAKEIRTKRLQKEFYKYAKRHSEPAKKANQPYRPTGVPKGGSRASRQSLGGCNTAEGAVGTTLPSTPSRAHLSRRAVRNVNYAGMDPDSDDEYEVEHAKKERAQSCAAKIRNGEVFDAFDEALQAAETAVQEDRIWHLAKEVEKSNKVTCEDEDNEDICWLLMNSEVIEEVEELFSMAKQSNVSGRSGAIASDTTNLEKKNGGDIKKLEANLLTGLQMAQAELINRRDVHVVKMHDEDMYGFSQDDVPKLHNPLLSAIVSLEQLYRQHRSLGIWIEHLMVLKWFLTRSMWIKRAIARQNTGEKQVKALVYKDNSSKRICAQIAELVTAREVLWKELQGPLGKRREEIQEQRRKTRTGADTLNKERASKGSKRNLRSTATASSEKATDSNELVKAVEYRDERDGRDNLEMRNRKRKHLGRSQRSSQQNEKRARHARGS